MTHALNDLEALYGPIDEDVWSKINDLRASDKKIGYYEDDFLYWKATWSKNYLINQNTLYWIQIYEAESLVFLFDGKTQQCDGAAAFSKDNVWIWKKWPFEWAESCQRRKLKTAFEGKGTKTSKQISIAIRKSARSWKRRLKRANNNENPAIFHSRSRIIKANGSHRRLMQRFLQRYRKGSKPNIEKYQQVNRRFAEVCARVGETMVHQVNFKTGKWKIRKGE